MYKKVFIILLKLVKMKNKNCCRISIASVSYTHLYKPPAMRVRDVGYTQKSPFRYKIRLFKPIYNEREGDFMANKANSLSHTKWVCKYHIVFTPKYRRKIIYNQYKESIRDIIKQLCAYKGVEILEGHLMPDHIHMLVSIPPKLLSLIHI